MGFELQVIAAVVLGGVSLFGGRGRLWRAMLGVVFIGLLSNGMNLVGISPYTQQMAIGVALIAALAGDQLVLGGRRERWQ
jgi:ribose transport system permease protein